MSTISEHLEQQVVQLAQARFGKDAALRTKVSLGQKVYWIENNQKQVVANPSLHGLIKMLTPTQTQIKRERKQRMETAHEGNSKDAAWVNADVLSRATGYSETAIHNMRRSGVLKAYKNSGRMVLYDKAATLEAMEQQKSRGGIYAPRPKRSAKASVAAKSPGKYARVAKDLGHTQIRITMTTRHKLERHVEIMNKGPVSISVTELAEWLITDGLSRLKG